MNNIVTIPNTTRTGSAQRNLGKEIVAFNRKELATILHVYGMRVSKGDWKDYAIDMTFERAVFSIFRKTHELPIYKIEKDPKLAKKQGAFFITGHTGQILKRGHSLETLLKYFNKPIRIVD